MFDSLVDEDGIFLRLRVSDPTPVRLEKAAQEFNNVYPLIQEAGRDIVNAANIFEAARGTTRKVRNIQAMRRGRGADEHALRTLRGTEITSYAEVEKLVDGVRGIMPPNELAKYSF